MGTEEKTEITNLPEGMSSEELDKLTTEEEPDDAGLAEETLAATEDESSPAEESVETDETKKAEEEAPVEKEESEAEEKPKPDPKDAVIGDFRRKLRDSELETAKLQGKLEAQVEAETKAKEPEKSPLDLEIEKQAKQAELDGEDFDEDDVKISPSLYRKQKAFEDAQASKTTTTEKKAEANTVLTQASEALQDGDLSAEKLGQGLDLKSVAQLGDKYLTKGDLIDLADIQTKRGTTATVKEAYNIMLRRIKAAGGEDAKLLQNAINIKAGKKSQPKPKKPKGKPDIDALTTEGEDEVKGEAETETHSKRLTDFMFTE